MARENDCTSGAHEYTILVNKQSKSKYQLNIQAVPKLTNPAFADNASFGAPSSSWGGEEDHKQGGALLSPAVRLASTNSWTFAKFYKTETK